MPTIANAATLESLIERMGRVAPESTGRWGTLTPGEMFCHLGDACEGAIGKRVPPGATPPNPLPTPVKFLLLYSPLRFPKGVETRAGVNPRKEGTRPGDFGKDRARAIDGLRAVASAGSETLAANHFRFGKMTPSAWHHWAFKHTDHHLRQFGV